MFYASVKSNAIENPIRKKKMGVGMDLPKIEEKIEYKTQLEKWLPSH